MKYFLVNDKISRENGPYYYNRPIYMKNYPFVVLAGDRPAIKMVDTKTFCSSIVPSIEINEQTKGLCDFDHIKTYYKPNIIQWLIKDSMGIEIDMTAVSMMKRNGICLKLVSNKDIKLDLVNYLNTKERSKFSSKPTDRNDPSLCRIKFPYEDEDDFISNQVELKEKNPAYVCMMPDGDGILVELQKDDKVFVECIKQVDQLTEVIQLETPDRYFDRTVPFSSLAQDAIFHDHVYHHGAMAWNQAFPGWRSFYGANVLGFHENVLDQANYYIGYQVKESPNTMAESRDEYFLGSLQHTSSVYFGRGHIAKDQYMYNFQTQFFDQLIHSWRWTNDKHLETQLYPSLKLHSEWQQKCFDPNEDGLYESYINSWPTDSIWANGGDCPEETTYAYNVNIALSRMAHNAGEFQNSKEYALRAVKIKDQLMKELWVQDKGYVGFYREAQGDRRLHQDSWLYSIFLPIDAGILNENDAAQALYYTEYGLERIKDEDGGELVYLSNFTPYVWSVRVIEYGDVLHLALAYFKTGLYDDGWKLLKGVYREGFFHERVPGGFQSSNTSTDFADIVSMYNRVVVEGLYGIRPNYPEGYIDIKPSFPIAWENVSIKTKEYEYSYVNTNKEIRMKVKLSQKAKVNLIIPLKAAEVISLKLNEQLHYYEIIEGFGLPLLKLCIDPCQEFSLKVNLLGEFLYKPEIIHSVGSEKCIKLEEQILFIEDPQNIVKEYDSDGKIIFNDVYGNHMFFAMATKNGVKFKRNIKLKFHEKRFEHEGIGGIPANASWKYVDLSSKFNSDIREIYIHRYKNSRDVSGMLKLGVDGFSPWTFEFWKAKPPEMDFSFVNVKENGRLSTEYGVEFIFTPNTKPNIIFTSQYDQFPSRYNIDINEAGKAIFILVAGSTNPMQTRIANARIILHYEDGSEEYIDIVPPLNFWSVCGYKNACVKGGDYPSTKDDFVLGGYMPQIVEFGNNCRGAVLSKALKKNLMLKNIELKTLSQEVIIGIMGISLMV